MYVGIVSIFLQFILIAIIIVIVYFCPSTADAYLGKEIIEVLKNILASLIASLILTFVLFRVEVEKYKKRMLCSVELYIAHIKRINKKIIYNIFQNNEKKNIWILLDDTIDLLDLLYIDSDDLKKQMSIEFFKIFIRIKRKENSYADKAIFIQEDFLNNITIIRNNRKHKMSDFEARCRFIYEIEKYIEDITELETDFKQYKNSKKDYIRFTNQNNI